MAFGGARWWRAVIIGSFAHAVIVGMAPLAACKGDMAWRLHKKKLEKAVDDLTNPALRPVQRDRESCMQAAEEYVETEKV